ncbi:MAG: hypothetical protein NZ954_05730 [Thermofilaceae archaeon]|nr:hypothetical protein [Thermofilaceae archaeon]MCX8179888.1 hypothetical protein [Thermofilaceae archaeon]MDW8004427.1 hypothetical protein [Thermofilaceae archaeon]
MSYVHGFFRMFTGILSDYKRKGWIDPSWLGDWTMTSRKGLHPILQGLAAEVAVEMGFHPFMEERWELSIGKTRRRATFDLTLRGENRPTIVVEIDTIDSVGYASNDRYVPKYVKNNEEIFKNKLVKPVLLKILVAQYPQVDELLHVLVLPLYVSKPAPWRRLDSRNAYSTYQPRYLAECRDSPKPYNLLILNEEKTELYINGNFVSRESW